MRKHVSQSGVPLADSLAAAVQDLTDFHRLADESSVAYVAGIRTAAKPPKGSILTGKDSPL